MRELLTTEQAAEILKIKPGTLRSWVSQRKIPYVKLGRLVRFDKNAIENFIEQNSIDAIPVNSLEP